MTQLKVSAVRIFVNDIVGAKAFYVDTLGLQLTSFASEHGVMVLSDRVLDILVEQVPNTASSEDQALTGRSTGISFEVEDIAHTVRHLLGLSVQFTSMPEKQYWGGQLATFKDSDGNELQLVEAPS